LLEKKIQVVIADDNKEFGDILYEYLNNQSDIEVTGMARDGNEACELIISKQPDIAILDIIMPVISGLDLLKMLRQEDKYDDMPIIMLTSLDDNDSYKKCYDLGAFDYINKPINAIEFNSRLKVAIESKRNSNNLKSLVEVTRKQNEELKQINAELKAAKFQLLQSEKMAAIGQLAAGIAHEVRNPLTTIRGFLQVARNKGRFSVEYVDLMLAELDRANAIITEFLKLAKDQQNDRRLNSLNEIIEALYPLIQAEALLENKNVIIDLGECPQLLLDEKEIRQLILNIAMNGLQAMESCGLLEIRTSLAEQEVILEIRDHGPGIKADILARIGTPFFTTKDNGTGMGLAICYSIAARHGAVIDIKTGINGTSFFIRFKPLAGKVNCH
jgi:signal transduction histidine kinase